MQKLTALVLLLLLVSGCGAKKYINEITGGVDNTEPPTPLVDIFETSDVNRLWSENIGKGTDELFIKLVPAIMDDQVFIADTRGDLAALSFTTGDRVWRKDTDLYITGGPGADVSTVLVGTREGEVVSFMPDNGEELWRARVSSEILSSPREANNVIIVRTIDGKIFALDATTGERLWIYDRTVPALTLRGTSTPVISGDMVIAGFDGGRVTALDLKNGKLIWETKVAVSSGRSELERMVDIDAQPLIYLDYLYIATFQSNITALSLDTGQILWQRDISSYTELDADNSYLFVTDEEGSVWALDRFSGNSIWKQEQLKYRNPTGPAVIGDKVVVGDLEGYLHWMDKTTGEFVARSKMSSSALLVKPLVREEVLFAYASDGTLATFTYTDKAISELPQQPVAEQTGDSEAGASEQQAGAITTEEDADEGFSFGRILDVLTADPEEGEGEADIDE